MIDARNNGKYAPIRHDKLIIQINVYRYDFDNECTIVESNNDRAWTRPRGVNVNDDPLAGMRERGGANNFRNKAAGGVSEEDQGEGRGEPNELLTCLTDVNILTWNIEGLYKYSSNENFKNYLKQFNIMALVETWSNLKGEFNDFLSGYTQYDCVRNKNKNVIRNSGGVGVFIS